uniref:Uncharacterized protein n=1 Tax=Rhizophora mucronata TaxID=61149 RepID=A0A2P2PPF6_RHIMU
MSQLNHTPFLPKVTQQKKINFLKGEAFSPIKGKRKHPSITNMRMFST